MSDNEHIRIVDNGKKYARGGENYDLVLALLAVAEAFMSKSSQTAQEHFIAIVKELEERFGFEFRKVPDKAPTTPTKRRFYCVDCKTEVPVNQVMPSLDCKRLFHIVNCDAAPGSGTVNEVPEGWPGEEPTRLFCMGCCKVVSRDQVLVEPTYMQHFKQKGTSENVREICGAVVVKKLE